MDLEAAFEAAVTRSKSLPAQANDTLLELYGLYKQATRGDASGKRPGLFDLVGRAKHDAWAAHAGIDEEQAMQEYVDLVERLS